MKKLTLFLLSLAMLAAWPLIAHALLTSRAASGTINGNAKSVLTFSSPVRNCLIVSNRHAATSVVYVLLNDSGTSTTATVSSTVYDFAVDALEDFTLDSAAIGKFPITSVGVYTVDTTPSLRVVGF